MYKRIMVPLDGSSFSETAIPVALSIAERRGARIDLVTVPEMPPETDDQGRAREAATEYLERIGQQVRGDRDVDVQTTLLQGLIASTLEEFATGNDTDLIVMATHGRGSFSRLWLGSVADEMVRHAPSPVLLVRPDDHGKEAARRFSHLRHVLLPLDGSEGAEAIVEHALAIGVEGQTRYTLLRVVQHPEEPISVYLPDTIQMTRAAEEVERQAEQYLERVATELRSRGAEVDTDILLDSHTGTAILRYADEHAVDLVAMATHGRGGLTRTVLGSVTDKVVRGADKPILIYRPQ